MTLKAERHQALALTSLMYQSQCFSKQSKEHFHIRKMERDTRIQADIGFQKISHHVRFFCDF